MKTPGLGGWSMSLATTERTELKGWQSRCTLTIMPLSRLVQCLTKRNNLSLCLLQWRNKSPRWTSASSALWVLSRRPTWVSPHRDHRGNHWNLTTEDQIGMKKVGQCIQQWVLRCWQTSLLFKASPAGISQPPALPIYWAEQITLSGHGVQWAVLPG